jgi:ParB-like chromosome segregation protein Spo0J
MKTEVVDINSVLPDPANLRRHGMKNLNAIKASLARFGQQKPIVVDADGIVRAGNGTLDAARELGWKQITIVRTPLRGSEATAYAIADNRTADLAEWNDEMLAETLASLKIDDEALAIATGYDLQEIEAMFKGQPVGTIEQDENQSMHDADKYAASVIRQIVLVFGVEEYERVVDAMGRYAEVNGLSNNTEVLVHLLETNGYATSARVTS